MMLAYCSPHTYIIGHYNSSVRIIDLVSPNTYVVCVNFIHKWRGYITPAEEDGLSYLRTIRTWLISLSSFLYVLHCIT